MACGHALETSVIIEDHFSFPKNIQEQNILTTSTPYKLSNLVKLDKELGWNGSLERLKLFVQSDLSMEGQWSSPGGEVKQFTSKNYTMKWYGKKKQKLVVIPDDKNLSLRERLVKFATLNKGNGHNDEQSSVAEGNLNMVEVVENSLPDDDKQVHDHITENQGDTDNSTIETPFVKSGHKFTNSQCHCRDLALQLKRIEGDIQQLKNCAETCDANENTWSCKTSTCKSEKAMLRNNLEDANNTIKDLKAKIMYLEQEKDNLVTALMIQQKDQIIQETKSSNQKQQATVNLSSTYALNTENQFQTLSDTLDNETQTETRINNHEIKTANDQEECMAEYHNKQQSLKTRDKVTHNIGSDIIVIGDSIIENIQPRKLTREKVHKYSSVASGHACHAHHDLKFFQSENFKNCN